MSHREKETAETAVLRAEASGRKGLTQQKLVAVVLGEE